MMMLEEDQDEAMLTAATCLDEVSVTSSDD